MVAHPLLVQLDQQASAVNTMQFSAAGDDIRPSWSLAQLAQLVAQGTFSTVAGVPHDFWSTHPQVWTHIVTDACTVW